MRYTYLGDTWTRQDLRGALCDAVPRHDGKCITRRGSMLVRFASGETHVVLVRRLRVNPYPAARSASGGHRLGRIVLRKHESGFRLHPLCGPAVAEHRERIRVILPPMCPHSKNPRKGSAVVLEYAPAGEVLESYSVRQVVKQFVGGFAGRGKYGPIRDMEGMLRTFVQMAADALRVPVVGRAVLVLDTGRKEVDLLAEPEP
jgi:hypothetical protein